MPRRFAVGLVVGAIIIVLLAALWFTRGAGDRGSGPMGGPPPPLVEVSSARLSEIAETVRAVGSVEAAERVTVTSQVTGKVREILFTEGQRVDKGAVLIRLDSGREEADLQAARAELRDARRQLGRLRDLEAERDISRSELDAAQARFESSRAGLAEARAALEEREIMAPFAGVVGLRRVSPGSLLRPGDTVTTLVTLSRPQIAFRVPSDILPRLRPGLEVRVRLPGGERELAGRVTGIDNTVDPATRAIAMEAELPEAGVLKPGLFLSVDLVLEKRQAVVIPEEALVLEGERAYVYVVDKQHTVTRQPVTVGERRPGIAEIREGLADGVTVVTAGVQKVRAGQPVRLPGAGPNDSGGGPPVGAAP